MVDPVDRGRARRFAQPARKHVYARTSRETLLPRGFPSLRGRVRPGRQHPPHPPGRVLSCKESAAPRLRPVAAQATVSSVEEPVSDLARPGRGEGLGWSLSGAARTAATAR